MSLLLIWRCGLHLPQAGFYGSNLFVNNEIADLLGLRQLLILVNLDGSFLTLATTLMLIVFDLQVLLCFGLERLELCKHLDGFYQCTLGL